MLEDANKLNHIFGNPQHNLDVIVGQFGSQRAALGALQNATSTAVQSQGIIGVFETSVEVGGVQVTVRGAVVQGQVRIGTAFIP